MNAPRRSPGSRKQRPNPSGKILIVGLGKTGLSCARYLSARGLEVAVTDSRDQPPGLERLREELPDVALFLGGFDASAFASAEQLVVSPGVSLRTPVIAEALRRGVPVLGDVELFARAARAPVVAVTGSNGKSTVTTLAGEMARRAGREVRVGGNLGTPALELLGATEPDLYVLELSSFQLETTQTLNAKSAAVLNVSPDHMDRYRDVQEYAAAKARVYRGDGCRVVNADDPRVLAMVVPGRRVLRFTLEAPRADDFGLLARGGEAWLAHGGEAWLAERELRVSGRHNTANALAALALGHSVGLEREPMLQTLREFQGLPHRTQWVAERDGVRWYNDSKGTNVGATLAALQGMPGKLVLIAGGDGKGADFTPLRAACAAKARAVVLIGRDAPLIEAALAGVVPVMRAAGMDQAVAEARRLAQPGDAVLLSPACASFDMFSGYEERGRVFTDAVGRLLG
ncbi:MAG: UDP-N-acetylmuramoyl-L-alanine--D-glutamate ligase [Gammaproteobacteria bacterium]|nr:UDP-N-acetylmuramoyl-L-alanine--D-glutamate ligase [Gammaproteobacteria bacterium]